MRPTSFVGMVTLMLERLRPMIRAVGVAAALLLVLSIAFQNKPPLAAGVMAPAVVGTTMTGEPFSLAALRGQQVVVNVWATWCTPCLMEMPSLVKFSEAHPEIAMVGLVAESSAEDAHRLIRKLAVSYPNVQITGAQQSAWHVTGLPSTFVIDEQGMVTSSVAGAITHSQLEDMVVARR
jgi:thiol-disulfide isomerase/thioredoxin